MTIQIEDITHPTTLEALAYAQDYYANYYSPAYPPFTYHRYDHSDHIQVLASWGYQGYFFVHSRVKLTVLYALAGDWTDEVAMSGWVFWRNPITGTWITEVESQETSVHHWQQAHAYHKEEEIDMAFKRARIDTYYPDTHKADITIYPLPGEALEAVPLAEEIPKYLAAQLPDCTVGIFYDMDPPKPQITAIFRTNALSYNEPFGYSGRWLEEIEELNADPGFTHVLSAQVPPDEVWLLQAASAQNNMRATQIRFQLYDGTIPARFHVDTSAGAGATVAWSGQITLKHNDRIRVTFMTTVAGDDLYVWLMGYKMLI